MYILINFPTFWLQGYKMHKLIHCGMTFNLTEHFPGTLRSWKAALTIRFRSEPHSDDMKAH